MRRAYFDRNGNPISSEQWSRLFEDREYRRVAETKLPTCWVSTVWLGLDHRSPRHFTVHDPGRNHGSVHEPPTRPIIFETMVLIAGDWTDQRRCSTEAEARAQHDEMVKRYSEEQKGVN